MYGEANFGTSAYINVSFPGLQEQLQAIVDNADELARMLIAEMVDTAVAVLQQHTDPSDHWYGAQQAIDALVLGKENPIELPQSDPPAGIYWYGAGRIEGSYAEGSSPEGSIKAFLAQYQGPREQRHRTSSTRARAVRAIYTPHGRIDRFAHMRGEAQARKEAFTKERTLAWQRHERAKASLESIARTGRRTITRGPRAGTEISARKGIARDQLRLMNLSIPGESINSLLKLGRFPKPAKRVTIIKYKTERIPLTKKQYLQVKAANISRPIRTVRREVQSWEPRTRSLRKELLRTIREQASIQGRIFLQPTSGRGGVRYEGAYLRSPKAKLRSLITVVGRMSHGRLRAAIKGMVPTELRGQYRPRGIVKTRNYIPGRIGKHYYAYTKGSAAQEYEFVGISGARIGAGYRALPRSLQVIRTTTQAATLHRLMANSSLTKDLVRDYLPSLSSSHLAHVQRMYDGFRSNTLEHRALTKEEAQSVQAIIDQVYIPAAKEIESK